MTFPALFFLMGTPHIFLVPRVGFLDFSLGLEAGKYYEL